MADALDLTKARRRGPSAFPAFFVGALIGAAATFASPRTYVAEVSLLFPTIDAQALKAVSKTLKLDASSVEWGKTTSTSDAQVVEAAAMILRSRAAINASLRDSKVVLPPTLQFVQGDSIESFRNNNVTVDNQDGASLVLKVSYPRAESARALCQGLLDYYTTFVHEHRLTNTARTRQQLEKKLVRVDKRLAVLERKLIEATSRTLADGAIRPDPKVMRELWKQRILESGSAGRILDEMRDIRKQAGQEPDEQPPGEDVGEDWRNRWGSTTLEGPARSETNLPRNARRSDIPSRLELERVYEETLLLYHAGLLQYDFLSMWESLENFDFEIVDPVTVHQETLAPRAIQWALLGGLICAVGALAFRRPA